MQEIGIEVGKLASPAGARCCATNLPGVAGFREDWHHLSLVFKWGLGKLFCTSLIDTKGMRWCFSTLARSEEDFQ